MEIRDKIRNEHYDGKVPYPNYEEIRKCSCGNKRNEGDSFCSKCGKEIKLDVKEEYNQKKQAYRDSINKGIEAFKKDVIEDVGLTEYECADRAYHLAWQDGHSDGFAEVLSHLEDIAYVIIGD